MNTTIDWTELFTLQKKFDTRIIIEKGLEGTDTIPWRTTAFLVELAEFANEARWFKMWSNDRKARRTGWANREETETRDPLLEEFVDALHFLIGLGLELDFTTFEISSGPWASGRGDLNNAFISLNLLACSIQASNDSLDIREARRYWKACLVGLMALGERVGLTENEIVEAFKAKDAENHARQDRGY